VQVADDRVVERPPSPSARATIPARDAVLTDATTRQLFESMRDAAVPLPSSGLTGVLALDELAAECGRDLGLDADSVQFLMAKGSVQHQYKAIARMKKDWRSRLGRLPERTTARPRIIFILCEGQAVRSFLLTDVCKKLTEWADLCVLSSYDIEADVLALGPNVYFFPVPPIRRTQFDMLAMYLGFPQTESPTNRRMVQRLDETLQKAQADGSTVSGNLRIWQIAKKLPSQTDYIKVYCWSLRLFSQIYALGECAELLGRLKGDFAINTSTTTWTARLWMRAAALEGLPSIANVISWDNMSTKTLLDEFADTYLLWSEEMEEDFAGTVPFLRSRSRVIVGSPQFEPIIQRRGLLPRAEFFRRYGLDPEKKLILYTTGSVTIFPNEQECLDRVLGHWRNNLSGRTNIMVRMHPKDRQGRYEGVQQKFPEVPFTLAGQKLEFDDAWVPTREDIDLLVNQLQHCDLVVNVASTMTLEGFTIDKPAINIGFVVGRSVSARYPMEDYYKSRHYSDVTASGAARLVNDYDELFAAIDDVLDRNLYDVEKQRRILRRKCLYTEDSSDRINAFLQQYAASNRRAARSPRPPGPAEHEKRRIMMSPLLLTRQLTNDLARVWRARSRLVTRLTESRQFRRLRKAIRRRLGTR
jgi:hypothetical protein